VTLINRGSKLLIMPSCRFIFLNCTRESVSLSSFAHPSPLACFLSPRNKFVLTLAAALWRRCRERLLNFQRVISKLLKQARDARKDNKRMLGWMKYEPRCDCLGGRKENVNGCTYFRRHRAAVCRRKYKDAPTCFRGR